MSLTELFPSIKILPCANKLRLMQFLVIDLAQGRRGFPLGSRCRVSSLDAIERL